MRSPWSAESQHEDVLEARRVRAHAVMDRAQAREADAVQLYTALTVTAKEILGNPARNDNEASSILRRYEIALKALHVLEERSARAQEAYRAAVYDLTAYADWLSRAELLTRQLRKEYAGKGPQYEILIRRLVQAEIAAQREEAVGGASNLVAQDRTVKTVMQLVQALQRHSEAQPTGSVRAELQEGILEALKQIEPEIKPVAPEAWKRAIDTLQRFLEQKAGAA